MRDKFRTPVHVPIFMLYPIIRVANIADVPRTTSTNPCLPIDQDYFFTFIIYFVAIPFWWTIHDKDRRRAGERFFAYDHKYVKNVSNYTIGHLQVKR